MNRKFAAIGILSALLLTGCAGNKESSISTESNISQSNTDASTDTQPDTKPETKEIDNVFLPEEKIAPIVTIPSTLPEDYYVPTFEVTDAIVEPLFELDGVEYMCDVLNPGYDFITGENGDILIVTYNVVEEPVEISEYARSIKEEQGWEPPEILDALRALDALEYLGRAEFIEDKANAFEYHNSYLFRYKDKILLIEPPSDLVEVYTSTMFKPSE